MASYILLLLLLYIATCGLGALGHQKIMPYSYGTSFYWWCFDSVSTSSDNESMVINFLEAGDYAATPPISGGLIISTVGTFKNGTSYPSDSKGNKVSYNGTLDCPAAGIPSSLSLRSRAPPRYTCDPNIPGITEEVSPGLGWANAVPDADATLDLTIGGEHVKFTGNGYRDKNWADRPFTELLDFWYWGRARVGSYSLVWIDLKAPGEGHLWSGCISKDGENISISCTNTSAIPTTGPPENITVSFDMGG
ncbi:hypothetical protein F4814DRAFT_438298 [Daldinia grandis]|nr:hypothetical protein F4814DRAFT_438298 [Daldinia grandis]